MPNDTMRENETVHTIVMVILHMIVGDTEVAGTHPQTAVNNNEIVRDHMEMTTHDLPYTKRARPNVLAESGERGEAVAYEKDGNDIVLGGGFISLCSGPSRHHFSVCNASPAAYVALSLCMGGKNLLSGVKYASHPT